MDARTPIRLDWLLLLCLNPITAIFRAGAPAVIPVTGSTSAARPIAIGPVRATAPTLYDFVRSVEDGRSGLVVGVYSPGILALRIAQQPAGDPGYVSSSYGYATQLSFAAHYGTTGLLAHNYLSGALFFRLSAGDPVNVVYGDGAVQRYVVTGVRRFQALRPNDPYSSFLDLDHGGAQLSAAELYFQTYRSSDKVVFQTCIQANGINTWGRYFVTARPIGGASDWGQEGLAGMPAPPWLLGGEPAPYRDVVEVASRAVSLAGADWPIVGSGEGPRLWTPPTRAQPEARRQPSLRWILPSSLLATPLGQADRGSHDDDPMRVAVVRPASDQGQPLVLRRPDPLSVLRPGTYRLVPFGQDHLQGDHIGESPLAGIYHDPIPYFQIGQMREDLAMKVMMPIEHSVAWSTQRRRRMVPAGRKAFRHFPLAIRLPLVLHLFKPDRDYRRIQLDRRDHNPLREPYRVRSLI